MTKDDQRAEDAYQVAGFVMVMVSGVEEGTITFTVGKQYLAKMIP